jgi:nucleotide-binding universal stress UspA family protein
MGEIRTILVAVDFSAHSDTAVEKAIDLAKKLGAQLHVVHAFQLPITIVSPYEVAIPDPYLEETRNVARQKLREVVERIRNAGLSAEGHLGEVPAAQTIASVAEKVGADLIVMGTRGLTGLRHVLLGSVAERTLRLAPCSVLAVKRPEDAEAG